jgi:GDP-L-fucose synthase
MRILITGGNGYIAKSLYNNLYSKYKIVSITRQDFDLTDSFETIKYFSDKYFDIIIHCAVSGGSRLKSDDWGVLDDNLKMYYNLLNCKNKFTKLIHFGSGAELISQNTPYGLSKHIIRQSILRKDNFYNIRIFGVFDENELDTRFIKGNIKKYLNNQSITIHQDKFMDFFYMKDLVSLVEYYILNENLPSEVNCSYNKKYTLSNIANIINSLGNYRVNVDYNTEGMAEDYNFKDINPLPNISFIGLENGIKQVYDKLKNEY